LDCFIDVFDGFVDYDCASEIFFGLLVFGLPRNGKILVFLHELLAQSIPKLVHSFDINFLVWGGVGDDKIALPAPDIREQSFDLIAFVKVDEIGSQFGISYLRHLRVKFFLTDDRLDGLAIFKYFIIVAERLILLDFEYFSDIVDLCFLQHSAIFKVAK
jgi:hypothetical protein